MKTLLLSFALFFCADPELILNNTSAKQATPPLSIGELISFRSQSSGAIEKTLFEKSKLWMNASEGYTKAEFIAKGESAWKLGPEGLMDAMLFYSPFADQGDEFTGPLITFTTISEDEYAALIREAGDRKDLKSSPDSNHKRINEIHFTGKDCNITFEEENEFGYYEGIVRVYGKKKN